MFSTFPSNYLGEQKNFFLFARNLINTMNMINTTPTESNLSGLNQKDFQKDINNKKTDLFILKNAQGMEVAVTNYGCAILSIMVPDKNGKYANVVLGHDSIEHVWWSDWFSYPCMGCCPARAINSHLQLHIR